MQCWQRGRPLVRSMGHQHLGFSASDMRTLADGVDLRLDQYIEHEAAPDSLGQPLFHALLTRHR